MSLSFVVHCSSRANKRLKKHRCSWLDLYGSIGSTSSQMVDVPAKYVILKESSWKKSTCRKGSGLLVRSDNRISVHSSGTFAVLKRLLCPALFQEV